LSFSPEMQLYLSNRKRSRIQRQTGKTGDDPGGKGGDLAPDQEEEGAYHADVLLP